MKKGVLICLLVYLIIFMASIPISASESQEFFEKDFFVGFAELYFGENNLDGDIEIIEDTDKYDENVDMGRINFYLKGKIKGKYLITAWLDTEEEKLSEVFKNIDERKENTPFEKIDAEKYYPVYGDDSKVSSEIKTAGKLYLKLESEELKAIWGNYKLNYDRNKLIQLSKNIYGANIDYKSDFELNTFWYQPFSTAAKDELEVTGGMLYYLRQDDLIAGSENIQVELRDSKTGRVLEDRELVAGDDYDINYLQGRIILKTNINNFGSNSLITDEDGENKYYLIVDYQYDYNSSESDDNNYGLQTGYNFSDNLYLGANYLKEESEDNDEYVLKGLNLSYQNINNSSFRIDYAESENMSSEKYFSTDGGINYEKVKLNDPDTAQAWNIEYTKLMTADKDTELKFFSSKKDEGFNSGNEYLEEDEENYGLSLVKENKEKKNKFTYEKYIEGDAEKDIYNLSLRRQLNNKNSYQLALENRIEEDENSKKEKILDGAVGFEHLFSANSRVYGSQQLTLSKNSEAERNDITTLGGELRKGRWRYSAEGTAGDKEEILFGTGYRINENSEIYTKLERDYSDDYSTERTVGASSKLNGNTLLSAEHRNINSKDEKERSNVLGLDYLVSQNLVLAFDYSKSDVENNNSENFNRDIYGAAINYNKNNFRTKNRFEYRIDDKSEKFKQLVLKSDSKWKYNNKFSYISEIEYSREKETGEDRYFEGTIGMAYRPIKHNRFNYLFKYTYLDKKDELNQDSVLELGDYPAEKSQTLALDLIFNLNHEWQLIEKLAYKNGEIKPTKTSPWARSETYLWANRINYDLRQDINIFAEYRILENKLAADRRDGFLIGAYKRFDNNTKIGIGYNFTDFSDDLTNLDYEAKGWFVNLIKAW